MISGKALTYEYIRKGFRWKHCWFWSAQVMIREWSLPRTTFICVRRRKSRGKKRDDEAVRSGVQCLQSWDKASGLHENWNLTSTGIQSEEEVVPLSKRRKKRECSEAWKKESVMIRMRELQMNACSSGKKRTKTNIFRAERKNSNIWLSKCFLNNDVPWNFRFIFHGVHAQESRSAFLPLHCLP